MLRQFARGLAKRVVRAMVRRTVTRMMVRGRSPSGVRKFAESGHGDEIFEMLDIFELLELAGEIPGIIDNARAEATTASAAVFEAQMGNMNPGQQTLTQDYCLPYIEEYWSSTNEPDPETFLDGMFNQHYAIEQALGDTAAQSYDAGSSAGMASIQQDVAILIATDVAARMVDLTGSPWSSSQMSDFGVELRAQRDAIEQLVKAGDAPSYYRWRYDNSGDFEYMKIPGTRGSGFQHRELSDSQFMGIDQPYWFTESRRLLYAKLRGEIDEATYQDARDSLYNATYHDPWSTSSPPGYTAPIMNGNPYDRPAVDNDELGELNTWN